MPRRMCGGAAGDRRRRSRWPQRAAVATVAVALLLVACGGATKPAAMASTPANTAAPTTTIAAPTATAEPRVATPPPRVETTSEPAPRTATEAPPAAIDERGDRVPLSFDPDDLLEVLVEDPAARADTTLRILTWLVEVDDRPLVIDRVIVWLHRHTDGRPDSWQLAHLYRHPLDAPPDSAAWHVSRVFDVPYVGRAAFPKAPTAADLESFLNDTWWRFRPSDGFWFLDKAVCEHAWQQAIGSPPNHRYR